MTLPIGPRPRSQDVAVLGWAAITVRIAWTLLTRGIRVTTPTLGDARRHVIYHLDPSTSLSHAEDIAQYRTLEFTQRARGRFCGESDPQDWHMPVSFRWRKVLDQALTDRGHTVFWKHYGDHRSLPELERRLQVDRTALEAAREGLREVVRGAAKADGIPLERWEPARLDRLIRRLVALSLGPCPPLQETLLDLHTEHRHTCARCDRAYRLLTKGYLRQEDLIPPSLGVRQDETVKVLALHFHPDSRRHRNSLLSELSASKQPLGDDLLLLDASKTEEVTRLLILAAEIGAPSRDHLRGAVVEGPGKWSGNRLLGPLAGRAEQEARCRPWGVVDGVGELPAPIPEPPSSLPVWSVVAALALANLLVLSPLISTESASSRSLLSVDFVDSKDGIWAQFDTPENRTVCVIAQDAGDTRIVVPADAVTSKLNVAQGDGSYRLFTPATSVLVASLPAPDAKFHDWVLAAAKQGVSLERIGTQLASANPRARFEIHQR